MLRVSSSLRRIHLVRSYSVSTWLGLRCRRLYGSLLSRPIGGVFSSYVWRLVIMSCGNGLTQQYTTSFSPFALRVSHVSRGVLFHASWGVYYCAGERCHYIAASVCREKQAAVSLSGTQHNDVLTAGQKYELPSRFQ